MSSGTPFVNPGWLKVHERLHLKTVPSKQKLFGGSIEKRGNWNGLRWDGQGGCPTCRTDRKNRAVSNV